MADKVLLLAFIATLAGTTSAQNFGKIWMITIGHDWGSHEYFDNAGYLQGFGIGLIDLVCASGNMDCRVVWDRYTNCWDSSEGQHPAGGKGLFSGWYDACTGWVPTVERIHTFSFSIPWIKKQPTHFWVLKGQKGQFNPHDLTNYNIGFFDGWASSEKCVARQNSITGHILRKNQIHHFGLPEEMIAALQNNQIDAIFTGNDAWSVEQGKLLDKFDTRIDCYLDGSGMMTRKDSQFIQYWNTGFNKLRNGNKFNRFCEETNKNHAHKGTVDCITF